jgi:hypothetical protein
MFKRDPDKQNDWMLTLLSNGHVTDYVTVTFAIEFNKISLQIP